jgi:hypothetical protein
MRKFLLTATLLLCSGTAQAQNHDTPLLPTQPTTSTPHQITEPPNPNPSASNQDRNNPNQPTQKQLDCSLFEAQTWEQTLSDWRKKAAWLCSNIAAKHASGVPLHDRDKAIESLLLAYEAQARAQMATMLEDQDHHMSMSNEPEYYANTLSPRTLVLLSGWLKFPSRHDDIASTIGLDVLLENLE